MQSLTINVHIADRARGIKGEMEGMKACECDRGSRKEAWGGQWIKYPKLDCGPTLSLLSRLPTVMTPGPAAGVTLHASVFPFPPATTTVMPACDTYRQPAHQNNAARATRKCEVGEQQCNNPEPVAEGWDDSGWAWGNTACKAFSTKGSLVEYPIEKLITAENPFE